ncbi:DUF6414 family protein [Kribbella solani]|uniref:DUF6414 family protein n=1 Tax=Kribbella solani TaxID=236067 RepID=UPI0029B5E1AA|nr:hypothetical protein [Kribbella solani]MDX2972353.1 hypothetical protein [Kribbella solani]
MKWIKAKLGGLRTWWRNRRRKREPTPQALEATFREFVYLDEVSVVSLLSARLGQVPSEFTQSMSNTSKVEISSSLDADAKVVKSKAGSRFESTQAQDTKVVSRATIQTGFRKLYAEAVKDRSLALGPIHEQRAAITADEAAAMLKSSTKHASKDLTWLAPVKDLHRGDLMEMEIELQADSVFHVSTVVSILAELARESDQLMSQVNKKNYDQMREVNDILDKLLVGLVPIRCTVVDYVLVNAGGDAPLVVNRKVIDAIPEGDRPKTMPVRMVAVLEKELFWKDLRRVLFAGSRFRVLCRLSREGLDHTWNPVKLTEVLSEVAPDFAGIVEGFGNNAIDFMKQYSKHQKGSIGPRVAALLDYADLVAEYHGYALDEAQRKHIGELAGAHADQLTSVPESRNAFLAISRYLADEIGKIVDPVQAAEMRYVAQERNGLHAGGTSISTPAIAASPTKASRGYNLNTEVIAIYW